MPAFRALIVDDQTDVRRMLRAALESLGPSIEVRDVPSGEEAILELSQRPAELLVIDVRLPGISGLELMQKARQRDPNLKVILVTGLADEPTRRQVAMAGATATFYKPLGLGEFLQAAGGCLGLASPTPEQAAPTASSGKEKPEKTLSAVLPGLRRELDAQAVLLTDPAGRLREYAGELPPGWTASSLPALIAQVGEAVSALSEALGAAASRDLLILPGPAFDLYLAHLGEARLAVLARSGAGAAIREALACRSSPYLEALAGLVSAQQVTVSRYSGRSRSASPAGGEPVPSPELVNLGELFSEGQPRLDAGEIDAFWDGLAEQSAGEEPAREGVLSYEQAQALGLAPK